MLQLFIVKQNYNTTDTEKENKHSIKILSFNYNKKISQRVLSYPHKKTKAYIVSLLFCNFISCIKH